MTADKRILLIEDDRETSNTLRGVLEAAGYNVTAAVNGVEGREQLQSFEPDLVITDMMMTKMGGFPVLEHLKKLSDPPQVIMITANEGGRHKAYAEMLGVAAYLRKPFAMDVLLEAVEDVFGSSGGQGSKSSSAKRKSSGKQSTRSTKRSTKKKSS